MRPRSALVGLIAVLASAAACADGPFNSVPPGDFTCGADFCDTLTQICMNEAAGSTCQEPPPACNGAPSCTCAVTCTGGTCQTASDGSVTVTCP